MADLDVGAPARGTADLGDDFLPKPWPKFVGDWPRLTGRQEPENWHGFDGDESDGDLAAKIAFEYGIRCMPWQWWSLRKICSRLEPDEDGYRLWTHPDVCLIVPRQNGKTEIALIRILLGMFVLGESIIYSAQRWATAEDVYDRLIAIILGDEDLKSRLQPRKGLPYGYSKDKDRGVIELTNGAEIRIGLRGNDMGVGMTKLDLVIFDEAYKLTPAQKTGLTGAQLAAPNPQTIYLSTPPVYTAPKYANCGVLASYRRMGLKESPELFFAEWMAPRPQLTGDPERDRRALAEARDHPDAARLGNPSHGVIHRQRDMDRERRAANTPDEIELFDADYLGWGLYPPDDSEREKVIPIGKWRDMTETAPVYVGDRVIAVHRTIDRHTWAIAGGCRTASGKVHLEVGYLRRASLPQVAVFLAILIELWDPAAVIVDGRGPANVLVARMKDLGYDVFEANTPQMAKACGGFIDAALSEPAEITHAGQPILEAALEVVQKRELPMKDFVFNDAEAGVPQWTAVVLAHWGVLMFAEEQGESASPAASADVQDLDAFDVLEAAF
ncbi:Gp5 [Mycolicibacterium canariasense]|uniref:Gp5 n=1 Tax=Mycolicibacterium canariasense TaxID=228230 RepID=A0A100W9L2_MYCCR|nr:hypothetical protein [Mycolicibacterium canariasense]MCV7208796.1 hypothetical protein [Mycolicibacterium canariasense]ORV07138.1 hypothetical protein AWB94_14140 [Mycolicibacterium canariasense]GAS94417.1 Gp5 [Mycolicibacterium canariasense]